ncbi:MAG: 50S ribosome-binding GTPase [Anaerolineae bacterium]|nr:50S ribosome-binding GTPase [Anaerolineae bacterium]
MPTNLPPIYYEIEAQYREATDSQEKIALLEEMFSVVPKHKGTDHLRADLRRRLAKLRTTAKTPSAASKQASVFNIDPEGAGQIAIIGMPNVGKSALVAALTHAAPESAPYPFTTWTPTPGMMPIDNVQVQIIDTPPLNREHVEPELFNLIRRAELLIIVIDIQGYPIDQLEEAIDILLENRIVAAGHEDMYTGSRIPAVKPVLVLANKCDDPSCDEDFAVLCELVDEDWTLLPISAATGRHFDALKRTVFEHLEIIRVYAKPPGKEPDFSRPFVLKRGATVEEFAGKVHQDFLTQLKTARVWGSTEHDGLMVSRDYVLHDGDVVELRA